MSAILGPEMAAPILWTPGKYAFFLQKNLHVHKIPRFGGGFWVWGGGGGRFYFYGHGDFSEESLARPLCRNVSGILVVQILEDFAGDSPGGFLWAIRQPKNKVAKKSDPKNYLNNYFRIRRSSKHTKMDSQTCLSRELGARWPGTIGQNHYNQ